MTCGRSFSRAAASSGGLAGADGPANLGRNMQRKRYLTPLTWPAISFAAMIVLGTLALCLPVCHGAGESLSLVDAAFLSTSAVCVTGLSPVDISRVLSPAGQAVLLVLIQVGGLGVMTYTSLIFLLWRKQVPFTSREAVSQALLGGDFDLGRFLRQVLGMVLGIELVAALLLFWHDPVFFSPFSALFHAVSAFCNAGFALSPDNMIRFREDGLVCTVICACIILGGIGFGVLRECLGMLSGGRLVPVTRLSRLSRLVIRTSLFLIVAGTVLIFLVEWRRAGNEEMLGDGLHLFLISLFHSIAARTAGFNMVDMGHWSHASLLVLMVLMFIGGGPGSCAGGIKVVTFRLLVGYVVAQVRGERQIVFQQRGVPTENLMRALTLFFLYTLTIFCSLFLLTVTENGILHRLEGQSMVFISLLFEVVSALGTVGLTVNVTPELTSEGKCILMFNMFAGRVGLLSLLLALRSLRPRKAYDCAESQLPVG